MQIKPAVRPRPRATQPPPEPLPRVSSPLLIEETARVLRELIVDGTLGPGQRLSERELGSRLGISRTPLREALRLLASERLVEVLPRRGARVADLDSSVVENVYPVLACLERLAVDLACRRVSDEGVRQLATQVAEMARARSRGDRQRFFAVSHEFHEAILEAAANATLRDQHRQLSGQVQRARFLSIGSGSEWDEALREHRSILAALRNRNGSAAVQAVARRLGTRKKRLLDELAQKGDQSPLVRTRPMKRVPGTGLKV